MMFYKFFKIILKTIDFTHQDSTKPMATITEQSVLFPFLHTELTQLQLKWRV